MYTTSDRIIVISEEIDSEAVREFLQNFYEIDSTPGPIQVIVCSGGGWSDGGMAIYDAIVNANNHVTTLALGSVGSIAVLIFEAGHTRIIGRSCSMFLHETSVETDASMSQMKVLTKEIERIHGLYCKLVADRSGVATKEIQELTEHDTFLDAGEVMARGLADEFLEPYKPAPKKKAKKRS